MYILYKRSKENREDEILGNFDSLQEADEAHTSEICRLITERRVEFILRGVYNICKEDDYEEDESFDDVKFETANEEWMEDDMWYTEETDTRLKILAKTKGSGTLTFN